MIKQPRRFAHACVVSIVSVVTATITIAVASAQKNDKPIPKDDDAKRPKLSLKAQPVVSMSPARVVLTAELAGSAVGFKEAEAVAPG